VKVVLAAHETVSVTKVNLGVRAEAGDDATGLSKLGNDLATHHRELSSELVHNKMTIIKGI
jgi:acid phosphatase family membrane protein YuiD